MNLQERLDCLVYLGEQIKQGKLDFSEVNQKSYVQNKWFTDANIARALLGIAEKYLAKDKLLQWLEPYRISNDSPKKRIALILAGNIPLVGFHDFLAVFVTGNIAQIKLSDKDKYLLPFLIDAMKTYDARVAQCVEFVDRIAQFDAIIATGSNSSGRYFEYYFAKYPHIIRGSRNSIAVLNGKESREDLINLGDDIYAYFGLGCRNVSKIYVPKGYNFDFLIECLHEYRDIILHDKYKNNFDHNYALLLLNRVPHLAGTCLLLFENDSLASRIATLHYEFYENENQLLEKINAQLNDIQCVVSNMLELNTRIIPFGQTQQPELWDYADGVDSLQFLLDFK